MRKYIPPVAYASLCVHTCIMQGHACSIYNPCRYTYLAVPSLYALYAHFDRLLRGLTVTVQLSRRLVCLDRANLFKRRTKQQPWVAVGSPAREGMFQTYMIVGPMLTLFFTWVMNCNYQNPSNDILNLIYEHNEHDLHLPMLLLTPWLVYIYTHIYIQYIYTIYICIYMYIYKHVSIFLWRLLKTP